MKYIILYMPISSIKSPNKIVKHNSHFILCLNAVLKRKFFCPFGIIFPIKRAFPYEPGVLVAKQSNLGTIKDIEVRSALF